MPFRLAGSIYVLASPPPIGIATPANRAGVCCTPFLSVRQIQSAKRRRSDAPGMRPIPRGQSGSGWAYARPSLSLSKKPVLHMCYTDLCTPACDPQFLAEMLVGERGFEPPAPASRRQCSTRLSYSPDRAGGIRARAPDGKVDTTIALARDGNKFTARTKRGPARARPRGCRVG